MKCPSHLRDILVTNATDMHDASGPLACHDVDAPVGPPAVDAINQAILEVLSNGDRKTGEIADAIDRSTRATRTRLARLVDRGLVAVIGKGSQVPKTEVPQGLATPLETTGVAAFRPVRTTCTPDRQSDTHW